MEVESRSEISEWIIDFGYRVPENNFGYRVFGFLSIQNYLRTTFNLHTPEQAFFK